jgi:DNA-binding response OmpR family regulator
MIPATGLRILLVEDDPDAQANMRDILELDGHHVDVAGSIAAALDRTNWADYEVVLLDRRLGDGTSDQLLPQLRQLAPRAATIVVTGYGDLDSTIAALREGAWDYILKPVNPDALRASLSRILQMQQSEARALQSERLAAVGEMTAVLIHESRNAFHHSTTAMELLQRRLKDRPDALELIERVQRSQARIVRLFQDVREYAAPIILNREPIAIENVLQAAWDELSSVWSGRTFEFREDGPGAWKPAPPGSLPVRLSHAISIDRERILQVVRNIF